MNYQTRTENNLYNQYLKTLREYAKLIQTNPKPLTPQQLKTKYRNDHKLRVYPVWSCVGCISVLPA